MIAWELATYIIISAQQVPGSRGWARLDGLILRSILSYIV